MDVVKLSRPGLWLVLLLTLLGWSLRSVTAEQLTTAPAATSIAPETAGAAETGPHISSQTNKHHDQEEESGPPALPTNLAWVRVMLISIVWVFVAAVVLGLVAMYFARPEPVEHVAHAADGGHGH